MSWLGNLFTGNPSSTSTSTTTNGTFAGVGQTTPSTLPYTIPTTHIVGPTPTGGLTGGSIGTPLTTGTYNPSSTFTINTGGMPNYGTVHISGPNPSISTDKDKIDLNELSELISVMKERLLIITPNFEKHEKYAALKKAYDHYKLLEAMLSGEENDNK